MNLDSESAAGCPPRSGVVGTERCPLCGEANNCQLCTSAAYKGPCWCERLTFPEEVLARVPAEARLKACVCRRCVEVALRARPVPRPGAGDFYFDPATGFLVFTAQFHRRRGYCCDSGCRHCPWGDAKLEDGRWRTESEARGAPAAGGFPLLVALLLALGLFPRAGLAHGLTEDFAADPQLQGWQATGDTNLFTWDAAGQRLAVTWDSARPHSFFARSLGVTLTTNDPFAFALDLTLTDAQGGVRPPRTGAMQLAFGFLNLGRAVTNNYARAAGKAADVVEFDWFPAGEFPGFGLVDATVSPSVFSSGGRIATSFTLPVELATSVTHRIRCEFRPAERALVTTLVSDGVAVPVSSVNLPADFGPFAVDAFAVLAWNESASPYDSLLAHGFVDNVALELPEPPIGKIVMTSLGVVEFASEKGWRYTLETSDDLSFWGDLTSAAGTGGPLVLGDPRDAVFARQFYRVRADRE